MTSTLDEPAGYSAGTAFPASEPGRFARFVLGLWERSPRWTAPAMVTACIGGAVAYTLLQDPIYAAANQPPACLVKLTTGFDCPGCGGTRAAWYLMHGNIPQAARHHAIFVFAVPFLLYAYVAWTINLVFRRDLPLLRVTPRMIAVFLGVWCVFSVWRNLPWAPFTWLYV